MIKEKKITKTVTITERTYICDGCGKSTKSSPNFRKCEMCGDLFCRSCIVLFDWDTLMDGHYSGDYPSRMCKSCWAKGSNYILKRKEINKEADKKTEELMRLWEEDCVT